MPKADLLAVAFTDLNGNDKYNPGKDTLIAAIVDTNKDGVVSVGDTIQWGTYPEIPDGSASGTGGIFTSLEGTITNVGFNTSTLVSVETANGIVNFHADPNHEELSTSSFMAFESDLVDNINLPAVDDFIFTDSTIFGAGQPNTDLFISTSQPGDQGFLDVLIF